MASQSKILTYLASLEELASPPPVLSDLVSIAFKQQSGSAGPALRQDPSVTTKMLQLSEFSPEATPEMGLDGLHPGAGAARLLIISMAIYNELHSAGYVDDRRTFDLWGQALRVANSAQNIASKLDSSLVEAAYVCGLMRDLGLLILRRHFPTEALYIDRSVAQGVPQLEAERRFLGSDHQEAGRAVACRWNFPEALVEAIGNHHYTGEAPELAGDVVPLITAIVQFCDYISSSQEDGPGKTKDSGLRSRTIRGFQERFALSEDDVSGLCSVLPKQAYHLPFSQGAEAAGGKSPASEYAPYLREMEIGHMNLYFEMASMFRERRVLSRRLLQEKYSEGASESFKVMLSTISHYISNSIAIIIGEGEILQQLRDKGEIDKAIEQVPQVTRAINRSARRISILLEELSSIASLENIQYFRSSKAIDIEKQLKERLETELCRS